MSTSNGGAASCWARVLLVLAIWAAIYLPGLGSLEIKGEEGRRILPAVTMLQTGNFIVPQVGSDPYFSKPPLVNWLVAASFKIAGRRSEWAARIPSALCVLSVAIAFVTIARESLGASGSLVAALIWLTNFGMVEKGRLIELEALYVSLTGLSFICWLSWWQEGRSKWLTWLVPWLFLGFGLLAKGPLHLLFFYAVVVAVLHCTGELRTICNAAHAAGILLMVAIFAAWAIPCLWMMAGSEGVAHTWARQFSGRLSGEDFKIGGWVMNIPRGLGYFLPWTPLLALAARLASPDRVAQLRSGLVWGIACSFVGVSMLPGSLPRYTMPLLVPAAWLTASFLTFDVVARSRWWHLNKPAAVPAALRLPMIVSAVFAAAVAIYAFGVMPHQQKREKVRNIARHINAALPTSEPLYAVDPDYQPFLFYVRDPIIYVAAVGELPSSARFILTQPAKEAQVASSAQWQPLSAKPILQLKDYRNKEVILFRVGADP